MHLITLIARKKLLIIEFRRFNLQLAQRTYYNCLKKKYRITLEFLLLKKIELLY
jgi:hypothetical protein